MSKAISSDILHTATTKDLGEGMVVCVIVLTFDLVKCFLHMHAGFWLV